MRVLSCNVNGIRAAARKGFFEWLEKQKADVICLQEVRAQIADLDNPLYHPEGYHVHYVEAEKKGYSGVAIYSRQKPDAIEVDWGFPLSKTEGRYICAHFDKLAIASVYLPSGTSGEVRQTIKYEMMDAFFEHLKACLAADSAYIFTGDWNIAHTQKDIKNWKANQKNSGFLPEERAWLDKVFALGYVDAFRVLNQESDQYTWWSQRGRARDNNVGWRIDYQIATPDLKEAIASVAIDSQERLSDHAPLIVDYAL